MNFTRSVSHFIVWTGGFMIYRGIIRKLFIWLKIILLVAVNGGSNYGNR